MAPPADAPGFLRQAQKPVCAGYNEYSVLIIPCLPLYFKENLGKIHEIFDFLLKKEYILAIKSEDVSIYKHIRICSARKTAAQAPAAAVTAAPAAVDETPVPIDIEANPKVKAAVEYLKEIVALMGVEDVTFSAVQKGEATIIRLDGDKMGALIGRRGETMESLSYLASLVANRMEGDYIKLGLDVAGYRGKRENDLTALAQKIGQKVRRSGRCFSMEPMNPYERRIIHSAISQMEGLRSESKGEGKDRHVVIYSTEPGAQTETYERRPRSGRDSRRGDNRGRRSGDRSERGSREGRRPRGDRSRGPRPSSVPERSFAPVDAASAAPVAPKRTQRVDDFADLDFGKIEL